MIIENSDAFYSWLMTCLGELCDADPAALAKYVMALVKKDKPEKELKEFCSDQLDVFLAKRTKPFVDHLFQTLQAKSYLQSPYITPDMQHTVHSINSVNSTFNACGNVSTAIKSVTVSPVVEIVPMSNTLSPAVKSERVEEYNPEPEMKDRYIHRERSRSSSSSRSLSQTSIRIRSRSRSRESDEKHKHGSEERNRRLHTPRSRKYDSRLRNIHRSRDSPDPNERRERDIRRDRVHAVGDSQRSRSPIRSRSSSWGRDRSRSCSLSPRSRSRSWSRSREHSKEYTRPDSRNSRNAVKGSPSLSDQQSDHGDTDYRITSNNQKQPSPIPQCDDMKAKHAARVAKRCKDYDEKGYCMRGDLCVYDHGTDPLVVENVSVLNFGSSSNSAPAANSGHVLPSMILHQQPPGAQSPLPPLPPSSPPPPPPPPPPLTQAGIFAPEPYNPESPGIYQGKRDQVTWSTFVPSPLHLPDSTHSNNPVLTRLTTTPHFNTSEPPPGYLSNFKLQRTRELIGVPTLDSSKTFNNNTQRIPDGQQTVAEQKTPPAQPTQTPNPETPVETPFRKRKFDYSRLGTNSTIKPNMYGERDRCTLEVRNIPRNLNTLNLLAGHFSKFGPVKGIVVQYDDDPEAALVEFSSPDSATKAYRNSEAVLNNRFIKVFYHKKKRDPHFRNRKFHPDNISQNKSQSEFEASETSTNVAQPVSSEKDMPESVSASNDAGESFQDSENEKTPASVSRKGSASRTTFNPAAMKKSNVPVPSSSVIRKYKEDQMKEAVKKKMEIHKKKQSILTSNVANQKMLLDRFLKAKNDKEKEFLKKTIEELGVKIKELQQDLKKECEELSNSMKTFNGGKPAYPNKPEVTVAANKSAEKELLDAEMDLYNKQHKGDDVTDLMYKVSELKQQAMGLFEFNTVHGGRVTRGGKIARRGRNMSTSITRSIDHRPRKILIMNAANVDTEIIRNHFLQFGEIESLEVADVGVYVTYRTRKEAETAFVYAAKCNYPASLPAFSMAWCHNSSHSENSGKSDPSVSSSGNEQNQLLEEEEEEEEDEDSEARSWRR